MKNFKIPVVIIFSFLVFLFTQNCQYFKTGIESTAGIISASADTPSFDRQSNANSELKYFAFFADGMNGVGTGNYIKETSLVANLHFINANSDAELISKIQFAKKQKSQVILMLESKIFVWQSVVLQNNYENNLQKLFQLLSSQNLLDVVAGFYMIDEPYWKNHESQNKISEDDVFKNLQKSAQKVQSYFKDKIIISSEAYPTLENQYLARIPCRVQLGCYELLFSFWIPL